MRIQIASDLHLFHEKTYDFPCIDSDVLVLAGDIAPGSRSINFAQKIADKHEKPVLFVAGNHEYYFNNFEQLHESFKNFSDKSDNVFFLDCDSFEYQGVRFLGATLWTDYSLGGQFQLSDVMDAATYFINDHVYIKAGLKGNFTPNDAINEHNKARAFLNAELTKPYDGKTVVITHHAPSLKCVHPNFGINLISGAFMSDCDQLVEKADLWVFGHTHANVDMYIGKCRLVSNQHGYSNEKMPVPFRHDLLIHV
ncbi:MAG: metallophosphoesterase [Methylophaga sp.]|nr:metallophosphoesterase [Methylophaga sp.]